MTRRPRLRNFSIALSILASFLQRSIATSWDDFTPKSDEIEWHSCPGYESNADLSCGLFEIPLDYGTPDAGTGWLGVAKYAAQKDRVGTLFFNPGGPGSSGVNYVLRSGKTLSRRIGGTYDIVSWDPRGVGDITHPGDILCFETKDEWREYRKGMFRVEVRGNFSEQGDLDTFYAGIDQFEEDVSKLAENCLSGPSGDYLRYVGTTATVRDMVALADVIDGPGLPINYWGSSYGTTIGNYFVNMFTDRVGRVVLDGVVNPLYHAMIHTDLKYQTSVESADEAFQGFANGCALAGPSGCILADPDVSGGKDILSWAQDLVDLAYDLSKSGDLPRYTSTSIRSMLFSAMYRPQSWARFANEDLFSKWQDVVGKAEELEKRAGVLSRLSRRDDEEDEEDVPDETHLAIACSDSIDPGIVPTEVVFDEYVRVAHEVSGFFGPKPLQPIHKCHLWPFRAAERFSGPFDSTLPNPILVIGNTADPITPFINAKAVADAFGDSAVLVEQRGFGHCTSAQKSKCTEKILINYFVHGKLPSGDDTICEVDDTDTLFPVKGITAATISNALAASSEDGKDVKIDSKSDSDAKLVEELKKEKTTYFIATIAFGAATGVLLIALVVQFILLRKDKKKYAPISEVGWNSAEKPYDPYETRH